MLTYLILIVMSVIIGLVAVLLHGRRDRLDPRVFLTAALLNAGAALGILLYRKRRKQ